MKRLVRTIYFLVIISFFFCSYTDNGKLVLILFDELISIVFGLLLIGSQDGFILELIIGSWLLFIGQIMFIYFGLIKSSDNLIVLICSSLLMETGFCILLFEILSRNETQISYISIIPFLALNLLYVIFCLGIFFTNKK